MAFESQEELDEIANAARNAAKSALNELIKIQSHLRQAEEIWESLDSKAKEDMANYHNETTSLWHCLRWGNTAADELVNVASQSPSTSPKMR